MTGKAWGKKASERSRDLYAWLRQSSERFAIAVTIAGTGVLCFLLAVMPKAEMTSHEHEHGHGHGGEHEEHEAAVEMDNDVMQAAGMSVETVQPIQLKPHVIARGQIVENANTAMNVKPRFSGIVRAVNKDFGDQVRKGDILMTIESAVTRSSYSIRTVIDGIVADKRVVAGSFVPENESVFRVVDLTTVWFEGRVPVRQAALLKGGYGASVQDQLLHVTGNGTLHYVSPTVDDDTQACDVRIELANADRQWRVGSFAEAEIALPPVDVALAIKSSALQEMNGQTVVFKRDKEHLEAVPVKIGRSDALWSEVLSGLKLEDKYLATNSFLAKAELLKSTAEHEH